MAITFPRTDVFSIVGCNSNEFYLQARNQMSRQVNGKSQTKKLGPQLWNGSWRTVPKNHDIILDLEAILNSLEDGIFTFYAGDLRRQYPREYPTGNFADTAKLQSVGSNYKSIIVNSAPASFKISRGDYFHFNYVDPITTQTIRYLGQVMESVTCNGSGVSPNFEIRPHLPSTSLTGQSIVFKKPTGVFKLVNSSVKVDTVDAMKSALSFSAYQSLVVGDV